MKAIKDVKKVLIESSFYMDDWWWTIEGDYGIEGFYTRKHYQTRQGAINNFKKFAKLNGITNYKIEGVTQ